VARKIVRRIVANGEKDKVVVNAEKVASLLGPAKFRDLTTEKHAEVGATTGLAWTEVGGQILTTECILMEGKGKLTITGMLGEVMQESAQAAFSYIRSRALTLGLTRDFYRNLDVHLHIPEGAIPKDGPSAGITMATTMCSALTKIPVRGDVAMTGEITLRGKVLPIGGLKEKLLAAHRAGILEAVLPAENEKDLAEVPENLRKEMKLHFVDSMDEVLQIALEQPLPEVAESSPIPAITPPLPEGPIARQ
jgi:ATP-dependent Lon protease